MPCVVLGSKSLPILAIAAPEDSPAFVSLSNSAIRPLDCFVRSKLLFLASSWRCASRRAASAAALAASALRLAASSWSFRAFSAAFNCLPASVKLKAQSRAASLPRFNSSRNSTRLTTKPTGPPSKRVTPPIPLPSIPSTPVFAVTAWAPALVAAVAALCAAVACPIKVATEDQAEALAARAAVDAVVAALLVVCAAALAACAAVLAATAMVFFSTAAVALKVLSAHAPKSAAKPATFMAAHSFPAVVSVATSVSMFAASESMTLAALALEIRPLSDSPTYSVHCVLRFCSARPTVGGSLPNSAATVSAWPLRDFITTSEVSAPCSAILRSSPVVTPRPLASA